MKTFLAVIAVFILTLTAACGGKTVSSTGATTPSAGVITHTLHLSSGDISEAAYRDKVRSGFEYLDLERAKAVCATYRSLSPETLQQKTVDSRDPDSSKIAVEILFSECDRIGG